MIRCLFDLRLFHSLHFLLIDREIIRSDGLDSFTWQVFAAAEIIRYSFSLH